VILGQLGQDRLDRFAGAAPGSPEVDDDRPLGGEDLLFEIGVGDLAHESDRL